MQSFAFWYEAEKTIDDISAKLNFNLWTECGWKKNQSFLDIGFLLSSWKDVKKLNFFVPFKVDEKNVENLGDCFKSPELASAIFNENLQPSPEGDKKEFLVTNKDTNDQFLIYCLDIDKDLHFMPFMDSASGTKKDNSEGTVIILDLSQKDIDKTKNIYFRFRIKNVNFDNLLRKYSSDKHGLQSVFNTTYTVDFRFFNKRSMNKTLLEKINNQHVMPVESLHFLVITKTHVNLITSDCKGRKLEENIWDDYVKDSQTDNKTTDLIAYHFKEKFRSIKKESEKPVVSWDNKNGSCEFFIKYEVEKSIWPLYLALTIGFGIIGSFLSTIFTHCALKW